MRFAGIHWFKAAFVFLGLVGFLVFWKIPPPQSLSIPAIVTVNAASTITAFIPANIFGNNINIFGNNNVGWATRADMAKVRPKMESAGNFFLRFPGGSFSDDYHWNGQGRYDAHGYWVPSRSSYRPGFLGYETYLGTNSGNSQSRYSHLDDGNATTTWLSNVDTDFPNFQWVSLDLTGSNGTIKVNAVTIVWGNPYAASFQVQYRTGLLHLGRFQFLPNFRWVTVSSGLMAGRGGTQGVTFSSVDTSSVRLLMTSSSGRAKGGYAIAELRVYGNGVQVSHNQADSGQSAAYASSMDPANYNSNIRPPFHFEAYMAFLRSLTPRGIPLITVNLATGTPQEAAAWVYYANVVKGYGIKYWQVGNEPEGFWETGGPLNANDYGRRFIEYSTAMRAVDSRIVVMGPGVGNVNNGSNNSNGHAFIQDFLARLVHNPGGSAVSCLGMVDFHAYAVYKNFTEAQVLKTPDKISGFSSKIAGWKSAAGVDPSVPVIMSEYNLSPITPTMLNQLVGGLWLANWMGEYIRYFGKNGFSNFWDVLNGSEDHTDPEQGDQGYLDNKGPAFQPHATYWAMRMMAANWAIAGDSRPHQLVGTAVHDSAGLLAVYSDKRPDGILSLVAINKDPAKPYHATIRLQNFIPAARAKEWTFDSSNYAWQTKNRPFNACPDKAPTAVTLLNVAPSFPVTFKPYSISVLQFTPAGPGTVLTGLNH
jgi:hypothetical protein